jgi:hypothetical protein
VTFRCRIHSSLGGVVLLAAVGAGCGEPFAVEAYLSTESPTHELYFEGEPVSVRDGLFVEFSSFARGREQGLTVTVRDGELAADVTIPLGTCLVICPEPCEWIGTIVRERVGMHIKGDLSIWASGSTCWDTEGRHIGYIAR